MVAHCCKNNSASHEILRMLNVLLQLLTKTSRVHLIRYNPDTCKYANRLPHEREPILIDMVDAYPQKQIQITYIGYPKDFNRSYPDFLNGMITNVL